MMQAIGRLNVTTKIYKQSILCVSSTWIRLDDSTKTTTGCREELLSLLQETSESLAAAAAVVLFVKCGQCEKKRAERNR